MPSYSPVLCYFYPRSPCGERHLRVVDGSKSSIISIHALLAESDLHGCYSLRHSAQFLSTLSLRRATRNTPALLGNSQFLSTLSLRRATRAANCQQRNHQISIHALLAESDISVLWMVRSHQLFLSTLSLRRATIAHLNYDVVAPDFYPRSPCGERLAIGLSTKSISNFYPRSPCGERPKELALAAKNAVFLSTLSLRRATKRQMRGEFRDVISIHALLAESDVFDLSYEKATKNFYPRSPCGERLIGDVMGKALAEFLSTLSLRRATCARL